ncbi:hypothetical protein V8E52_003306 [Russula decolorans]|jgi:hypothetical protein
MSHPYHLRPNVRARMQRRLDAHVAVFGEQNKDKIVAVPSNTERSLSPDPDQAANHQSTDSTEDVVITDGSDSGDSLSDLGSDSETVAPHTPSPRGQVWPSSSHLDAPKAPQHIEQENRPDGSVGSSSSVRDSPALIAEHKKALKAHLEGDVEGRRRFLELEHENMLRQAKDQEERIATMRREYEGKLERFRRENADIFGFPVEGASEFFDPLSPEPFERGDLLQEIPPPTLPQGAGPSRFGQGAQEDCKQQQRCTPRRESKTPITVSPGDKATGSVVVVARRVQKLGPCGTVVIDHETGDEKLVTKCYQVREEELRSIDGDGDSVMGSEASDD